MICFALLLLGALILGWCGRSRRFGFWGYFFAALAFTPLFSTLLLLASKPHKNPYRN